MSSTTSCGTSTTTVVLAPCRVQNDLGLAMMRQTELTFSCFSFGSGRGAAKRCVRVNVEKGFSAQHNTCWVGGISDYQNTRHFNRRDSSKLDHRAQHCVERLMIDSGNGTVTRSPWPSTAHDSHDPNSFTRDLFVS